MKNRRKHQYIQVLFLYIRKITLPLQPVHRNITITWPVRLSVRTQDFHSCKRGSTPLRATKKKQQPWQQVNNNSMANIKSAKKRIRNSEAKRDRNRYQHKTTRTAIKGLKTAKGKTEAEALLPKVTQMVDKLAKKNIIHKNKASNLKSKLTKMVSGMKK